MGAIPRVGHPAECGRPRTGRAMFLTCCSPVNSSASSSLPCRLVIGRAGDENPARVAQLLQAGRDVHAIAEKIAVLDDDIAEIDADPEHDAMVRRNLRLIRSDILLHRNGEGCSVHDRTEFGNRAITHQFDDAAVMLGQEWIDDFAPQGLDGVERAILVTLDEAGITDDVRCDDCCQPPFDLDYPMAAFPAQAQTPCLALRMPGASHPAIRIILHPLPLSCDPIWEAWPPSDSQVQENSAASPS